jgi:hypothetical protein
MAAVTGRGERLNSVDLFPYEAEYVTFWRLTRSVLRRAYRQICGKRLVLEGILTCSCCAVLAGYVGYKLMKFR